MGGGVLDRCRCKAENKWQLLLSLTMKLVIACSDREKNKPVLNALGGGMGRGGNEHGNWSGDQKVPNQKSNWSSFIRSFDQG